MFSRIKTITPSSHRRNIRKINRQILADRAGGRVSSFMAIHGYLLTPQPTKYVKHDFSARKGMAHDIAREARLGTVAQKNRIDNLLQNRMSGTIGLQGTPNQRFSATDEILARYEVLSRSNPIESRNRAAKLKYKNKANELYSHLKSGPVIDTSTPIKVVPPPQMPTETQLFFTPVKTTPPPYEATPFPGRRSTRVSRVRIPYSPGLT